MIISFSYLCCQTFRGSFPKCTLSLRQQHGWKHCSQLHTISGNDCSNHFLTLFGKLVKSFFPIPFGQKNSRTSKAFYERIFVAFLVSCIQKLVWLLVCAFQKSNKYRHNNRGTTDCNSNVLYSLCCAQTCTGFALLFQIVSKSVPVESSLWLRRQIETPTCSRNWRGILTRPRKFACPPV